MAVGKLWNLACSPKTLVKSPETLALMALSLKSDTCRNLVQSEWNKKNHFDFAKSEIASREGESPIVYRKDLAALLEKRDLMDVCDGLDGK